MLIVLSMIVRRILILIPLMLAIILFVFVILELSPNNSALAVLGDQASAAQIAQFNAEHGLDQPFFVRYVSFIGSLLRGDLGTTFALNQPVGTLIATALPLTIQLTFLGVVGALIVALTLGMVGALYRDRWPDQLTRFLSIAGISIPSFWLGILLIQRFSTVGGGPFASGGYVNPADSVSGWLGTMTLPAISMAVPVGCALARIVRTSMVEELDRDYVRTAVGAGLPPVVVVGRNVLRNALVTPLTVLGLQIGYLIGGVIIIEAIFTLPGMGTLIMQAVKTNDIALARGTVVVIALGFVVVNLVVDILYLFANPRLRGGR